MERTTLHSFKKRVTHGNGARLARVLCTGREPRSPSDGAGWIARTATVWAGQAAARRAPAQSVYLIWNTKQHTQVISALATLCQEKVFECQGGVLPRALLNRSPEEVLSSNSALSTLAVKSSSALEEPSVSESKS